MKKTLKLTLWTILVVLVAIQFVPVDRTNPESDKDMDLFAVTNAPKQVQDIMHNSCYDCHSNQTIWPWYSYVAPISFVLQEHVVEGRDHLNFSEWGSLDLEDQLSALKHMKKEIEDDGMPLSEYLMLHGEAKMTDDRKAAVLLWIDGLLAQ